MESPISDHSEMSEQLERAPELCGCDECVKPDGSTEAIGEGGGVHAPTGSMSNTVNGPTPDESRKMESSHPEGTNGREESTLPQSSTGRGNLEYIFSSMKRRGNRNKALLLRERREELKDRRMNGFNRCGRVSSKQVSQECVQDRSQVMVVIGSDAVSLFPSLTKLE